MSPFARGGVKLLYKKRAPNMPESVAGRAACLLIHPAQELRHFQMLDESDGSGIKFV